MPAVMDSALSREFAERFRELYDAEGAETIDAEGIDRPAPHSRLSGPTTQRKQPVRRLLRYRQTSVL
jgi:hypothetical protein